MDRPYFELYESGELGRRVEMLEARLTWCDICPRECHVNRIEGEHGFCRSGYLPIVASCCDHHGEEPAISGSRGTGAIFFGNCNMRCVYCQNHQISQSLEGSACEEMGFHALAERMVYLQDGLGCHSISFVSPSHFVPQMVRAILEAVPLGLRVPLVYNTNAYDSVATLQLLDGIVDVYLPDLKYASDALAARLSGSADYVAHSRAAILEMYRQVGTRLVLDDSGVAQRGLIVRHLVLPNGLAGSRESLNWLARELSPEVTVSIMSQYYPAHLAPGLLALRRTVTPAEYSEVLEVAGELEMENGWVQEMDAAASYRPHFERDGHPFVVRQA